MYKEDRTSILRPRTMHYPLHIALLSESRLDDGTVHDKRTAQDRAAWRRLVTTATYDELLKEEK